MRPIDANALLEKIMDIPPYCGHCDGYGFLELEMVADSVKDAPTIEQPQWTSVEDGLPETIACYAGTAYSEAVIVFTTGKKVLIAIFDGENFLSDGIDYWEAEHDEITHWMPLPPPPKGVE